jgi:hypothetical protein
VIGMLLQTRPSNAFSLDELRAAFDAGKYQETVKQATKILSLRGEEGYAYDKHEVMRLKAESHLRLGQNPLAIDAFREASELATDAESRDADRATVILIERCKRSSYIPKVPAKSGRPEGIDILEPASRTRAFESLLTDESAELEQKIALAKETDRLPPVIEAVDGIVRLGIIERATHESGADSNELLKPLAKRAESMTRDELKRIDDRVEDIFKSAEKRKKMGSSKTYRKQGLAPTDAKELTELGQICVKLTEASTHLAEALPDDATKFDAHRMEAQRLAKRANEVLRADYSGNFDRP